MKFHYFLLFLFFVGLMIESKVNAQCVCVKKTIPDGVETLPPYLVGSTCECEPCVKDGIATQTWYSIVSQARLNNMPPPLLCSGSNCEMCVSI